MLDKSHRITSAADYKYVVRRGRRSAGGSTVTYICKNPNGGEPRFGFIVAKTVGNAVTRNRVRRRLKAICHLAVKGKLNASTSLSGVDLVIRALPSAAEATFDELTSEIVRALGKAVRA